MSTINEREALRRAFHLADGIEPGADGLQRIQARLRPPRPLALAWAEASWTYLRMRIPDELQRLWEWLLSVTGRAWERFGPKSGTTGGVASRTIGWLRPAAVLGVTIFVVALGTYVAIDAQQAINPSASNSIHSGGSAGVSGGGQRNPGGTNSQGHSALGSTGTSGGTGKSTCRSSGTSGAAGSSSSGPAGQTQSSSPSVSPSDGPGGLSPSPGANSSSSPSPGATTTGSATGAGIPAVGSSSPGVATLPGPRVMAGSVPTPSPSPCTRRTRRPGSPAPNASPAVFSYGRLNDGG